jgi:recombination protein RecA
LSDNVEIGSIVLEEEKVKNKKVPKEKIEIEKKEMSVDKKAKLEALDKAAKECEKEYGKNAIMRMDGSNIQKVPCISTGILGMDLLLGGSGFPKGRIIEIIGMESSAKTTLCLQTAVEVQKNGGVVAIVDAEQALDLEYAQNLGLNVDELYLAQPECGEVSMSIAEKFIEAGVDLLIVDSVAALTPRSELEGDLGDANMGRHAKLMSAVCRMITAKANKSKTTVLFTNQYRQTIGIFSTFVGTGGNALKFFSSIRVELKKAEVNKVEEGEDATSSQIKCKILKNKIAPPFKKGEFTVIFGKGIDKYTDLITQAIKYEVIKKAGAWFSGNFNNQDEKWQGMDNVVKAVETDTALYQDIYNKVIEKVNNK